MAFIKMDFFSEELSMTTSANVIIPEGVPHKDMSVVYLLHGLSDNCSNWARLTSVERYANSYKCAVVMPEVQRSFYIDMEYGINYFSYISKELPQFICDMFGFKNEREKKFVAGLSMGGYGTLKCALTYPESYKACAAFSSACDIVNNIKNRYLDAKNKREFSAILGTDLQVKEQDNLYALCEKNAKKATDLKIFMTCGDVDMLYKQNVELYNKLEELGYNAEFKTLKGDHTWEVWDKSIEMAFERFFGEKTGVTKTPLYDGK